MGKGLVMALEPQSAVIWLVGPPDVVGPLLVVLAAHDPENFAEYRGLAERSALGELVRFRFIVGRPYGPMPDDESYRMTQMEVDEAIYQGEQLLKQRYVRAAKAKKAAGVKQKRLF
jgi:hypothetical protein